MSATYICGGSGAGRSHLRWRVIHGAGAGAAAVLGVGLAPPKHSQLVTLHTTSVTISHAPDRHFAATDGQLVKCGLSGLLRGAAGCKLNKCAAWKVIID